MMDRRKNYIAQCWPIAGGKIEVVLTTDDPAAKAHFELMHDVARSIEMWSAAVRPAGDHSVSSGDA